MRALIKTVPGVGNLSVMHVPAPVASSGEALVRVLRSGLCGTDLLVYDDVYRGRNRPVPYPLIPGHEASGEVVELGPHTAGQPPAAKSATEAVPGSSTRLLSVRSSSQPTPGMDP